jgi:hypothetical protein
MAAVQQADDGATAAAHAAICSICQDALTPDDTMTHLLCMHKFHRECMARYMDISETTIQNVRCPDCRIALALDRVYKPVCVCVCYLFFVFFVGLFFFCC